MAIKNMYYSLKDLQGAKMHEELKFASRQEVRNHLFEFHSQDLELNGTETLEDLLDIGGWELVINNDIKI